MPDEKIAVVAGVHVNRAIKYVYKYRFTTSFEIYFGWNCSTYPVSLNDSMICGIDTTVISFINRPSVVQVENFSDTASVALCDSVNFKSCFSSVEHGAVYPQQVINTTVPGFTLAAITLSNDTGYSINLIVDSLSGNYPIPPDSILFPGGQLIHNNEVCVTASFYIECSFMDNLDSIPPIYLSWTNYCGDSFNSYDALFKAPTISGSLCTDCFSITKTVVPTDTAVIGQLVTFTIDVCNFNDTAAQVELYDYLPPNFTQTNSTLPTVMPFLLDTGCVSYYLTGYYNAVAPCTQTSNIASLHYTQNDSLYDRACLDVFVDCSIYADTVFADSTLISSYNVSSMQNIIIDLKGRLYIDTVFEFKNCLIYAEPGAEIIVTRDMTLLIDESEIVACTDMWQGITIEGSALLRVYNHSIIRHAERGVLPLDRSRFTIENSLFEDCVYGIYVPANPLDAEWNITGYVAGTTFNFSGQMRPMYNGQLITYITKPRAGINFSHMVMEIGDNSAKENRFLNLNTGIYAAKSNLRVKNCNFENIIPDSYGNDYDGAAIATMLSTITVAPALQSTNTILSCNMGVYTKRSNAILDNLIMNDVIKGVYTEECIWDMQTKVLQCNITATQFGIDWRLNTGASMMLASDNVIHVNGNNGIGVNMAELNTTGTANYEVKCNSINMTNGYTGITANNILNGKIYQNNVIMAGSTGHAGIELGNNKSSQITYNSVVSNDDADTNKIGIATHISDRSTITCNTIDETGWGFFFGGVNPSTSFRGNDMYNHYDGLRLNNVAVIDTQTHAGNRWLGTYGNYGAVNMNWIPTQNLALSLFYVNLSAGSSYFPSTPTSNPDNSGWFRDTLGTTYSCQTPTACNFVASGGGDGGSEELRMSIANDDTLSVVYIEETKNIAQMSLFEELKEDSTIYTNNIVLQQFKTDNELTSIGALYNVKDKFKEAETLDNTSLKLLDSLVSLVLNQIFLFDSISNSVSTTTLIQARQLLIDELISLNSQKNTFINQLQTIKDQKITEALSNNSTISPIGLPQVNEKEVNRIAGQYLLNGKNSLLNEYANVTAIANQCPYEGGKAVYRARVLLSLINDNIQYNDASACIQSGIFRNSPMTLLSEILIIPNPANEKFEIILPANLEGSCEVIVIDLLGRKVKSEIFDCKDVKKEINTSNIKPGVYFIRAKINSDYKKSIKLIITR